MARLVNNPKYMLGIKLEDPYKNESNQEGTLEAVDGLKLLPIKTKFGPRKHTSQIEEIALWPAKEKVKGFEMHYGETDLINNKNIDIKQIFNEKYLGWILEEKNKGFIGGTYLHGIFENIEWKRQWINKIRTKKGLKNLNHNDSNRDKDRERLIDLLTDFFEKNINLDQIL